MNAIGRSVPTISWDAKTSGTARFSGDVALDGVLIGGVLRSPHAHARLVTVDTRAARALPGVRAVVTADDLADELYLHSGGQLRDRRPLARGTVRYVGEEIAAVAAETPAQLAAALAAIEVRYEPLPPVLRPGAARRPRAPLIHARTAAPNVALEVAGSWGDPDAGAAASGASVTANFRYGRVGQAPMEPNVTLASWSDEAQRMDLWTSSQSPWFVIEEVANALALGADQIVCHDVDAGGGFGSKSHISEHEVIAAALAKAARRPVRLALSRSEEFTATKPRHEFDVHATLHADEHGRMSLFETTMTVDNGAYNHYGPSVLTAAIKKFGGIYQPDGVRWHGTLVDTTTTPGGQFRGYGGPQAVFALECLVDELAERCGRDPVDFRLANANAPGSTSVAGMELRNSRLAECLTTARAAIGWEGPHMRSRAVGVGIARGHVRGIGFAAAVHGSGTFRMASSNRSEALVRVDVDGHVQVHFGGADAGTGQRTIIAQAAAEELGVDLDAVSVVMSDGDVFDLGAWSSRGTHLSVHATAAAARAVADDLRHLAADKFACDPADVVLGDGCVLAAGSSLPIGDLVAAGDQLDAWIERKVPYVDPIAVGSADYSPSYTFAVHAAEVDVDCRTGQVRVVDYVAVHDIGRAINPMMVEGQIIGGVVQGIGGALTEELVYADGRPVVDSFLYYGVPRAPDVPPVRVTLVEGPEPAGPYGAKSVGELPIIPPAPAIANAVYDAIGVRMRDLPLTPDKVLAALRRRDGRPPRRFRLWRRPARWQIELARRAYPLGLKRLLDRTSRLVTPPGAAPAADVVHPTDAGSAVAMLGPSSRPLAGGSDLLVARQTGTAQPVRLVSLRDVDELRDISASPSGAVEIGAAVTLAALERSDVVPNVVAEAVATIASAQTRAVATIGGNLLQAKRCWFYRSGMNCYKRGGALAPCFAVDGDHRFHHAVIGAHRCQAVTPSDLATVLIALDAAASLQGPAGTRRLQVAELYSGPGESVLGDDELLTTILLPAAAQHRRAVFEKLARWTGDFAVAAVAVSVTQHADGTFHDARVVLGGMAPTPLRARATEAAIAGRRAGPQLTAQVAAAFDAELDRLGHPLARNGWKLDAAVGLLTTALERLA